MCEIVFISGNSVTPRLIDSNFQKWGSPISERAIACISPDSRPSSEEQCFTNDMVQLHNYALSYRA